MEILRFDESDAPAPKRKRPSKAWLALSLVAALMGVGTAFASSTININTSNITSLGQGVASVVGCDDNVGVAPESDVVIIEDTPAFQLSKITVSDIDTHSKLGLDGSGVPYTHAGKGCGGGTFKLQVFTKDDQSPEPVALTCAQLIGADPTNAILGEGTAWGGNISCENTVTSDNTSPGAIYFNISKDDALLNLGTDPNVVTDHKSGNVRIKGLKWSKDVSYLTLVSLDAHEFPER